MGVSHRTIESPLGWPTRNQLRQVVNDCSDAWAHGLGALGALAEGPV